MTNKNQTTLNPYLTFSGNCREAMTFYKECLAGELELMTFEGSPMEISEEHKDKIMNATWNFGAAVIMASAGQPNQPEVNRGNDIHLSIASNDETEAERFFNNLSAGGTIIMPFKKTFWGAKFGMCMDKYGINWMINCELEKGLPMEES